MDAAAYPAADLEQGQPPEAANQSLVKFYIVVSDISLKA